MMNMVPHELLGSKTMKPKDGLLSATEVAEDYRQQRQAAAARKAGFSSLGRDGFIAWLEHNQETLIQIARDNGAFETDAAALVQEYKDLVMTQSHLPDFDDLNAQIILRRVVSEIEGVCRGGRLPIRGVAVFGISPELGLKASQMPVLGTDSSIIEVSLPFITLCNQISKIMALTLPYERVADQWRVSNDPAKSRRSLKRSHH
jgi:hypothetical protein